METNQIVLNLLETTSEMVEVLGHEVESYNMGNAQICDIYCSQTLSYVPAIVIEATKGEDIKYLVYSPLSTQMFVTDEELNTPSTLGATYKNGCLSMEVVATAGENTLQLSIDNPEIICASQEKAQNILTAFLAVNYEQTWRMEYYKTTSELRKPKPCLACGILSWSVILRNKTNRVYTLVVNVASSHVYSFGMPMVEYKEIMTAGRYLTLEKMTPSQTYFWNGKFFKPCADESAYMTLIEAKEAYENLPESIKEQYDENLYASFCAAYYQEELYYSIGRAEGNKVLLMNASNAEIIEGFFKDICNPNCEDICFPVNKPGVKCTYEGWNNSRSAFAQKAVGF